MPQPIPLLDLRAEYHELKSEIDAAVGRVLESGQYILGNEVAGLEQEFASYCDVEYAIGVNSGTSALHLALLAAGIGAGDEVITVPFTFYATAAAIGYVGAVPVYVDIHPGTFNVDVTRLEAAITDRTRAILPVHLYGQPADMDPILEIAARYKLLVIEDVAQAHGADYKGRRTGSIGDIGCFSFYPTKNLGAAGEGGMVTTRNAEYARTIAMLRNWGEQHRYYPVLKGYNYRLAAIQAAILRVKLRKLEQWIEARRALSADYDRLLADAKVVCPASLADVRHVHCLYTIQVDDRGRLQKELEDAGIQTAVHYPLPIHLMPAYADARYKAGDFPVAERCAGRVLSLPLYPQMTRYQVERVAGEIIRLIPRNSQESALSRR
jgi:dTDP-4-amino-4,6-dideoxygalactose transaminase